MPKPLTPTWDELIEMRKTVAKILGFRIVPGSYTGIDIDDEDCIWPEVSLVTPSGGIVRKVSYLNEIYKEIPYLEAQLWKRLLWGVDLNETLCLCNSVQSCLGMTCTIGITFGFSQRYVIAINAIVHDISVIYQCDLVELPRTLFIVIHEALKIADSR